MAERRWLYILLPIAFLFVVEALSDSIFDALLPFPRDTILIVALVAIVSILGAQRAFATIDRLTADLRLRNRDLEARTATLRSLHQVSVAVSAASDTDRIMATIVDSARSLLGTEIALLVLYRSDGEPRLARTSGPVEAFRPAGDQPGDEVTRFLAPGMAAFRLASPVRTASASVGTLAVAGPAQRAFGVEDVETLSSLASQAAIALENARLQERLRELAITAERERIAREMHDGLAQVLGYVNTKSQAVEELLSVGRVPAARRQLEELAQAARSVYVDVREAILGLSSPITPEHGLVGALESYVERFAEASKLAASIQATPEARLVELGPAAQAHVFRIVQEGLTNVRKHASAGRVAVRLSTAGVHLVVTVEDDGQGFDPEAEANLGWPHFGLGSMRDRAAAIGAEIEWRSRPEGGTTLRLLVPIQGPADMARAASEPREETPPSRTAASPPSPGGRVAP